MSKLESAANIATVFVGIAVCLTVVQRYRVSGAPPHRPAAYAVSDNLSGALPVTFAAADRTAIVVVQTGCRFCENSIPFYRRLIAERNRLKSNVQIVFVAPARDTGIQASLALKGVVPDTLLHTGEGVGLHVVATPTLIVADRDGKVVSSLMGELADAEQREVFVALFGRRVS